MKKPRNISWIVSGFFGLGLIGWTIHTYPPTNIWALVLFYSALLFTLYSFMNFFLMSGRRAFLISIGITAFLMLRSFNLRSPLYIILLIASLLSLELVREKR